MTANQLAYAALQESTRHNMAGEEETNRHNVADEALRKEANSITSQIAEMNDRREQEKIAVQREYNDILDRYDTATAKEKAEYDEQLLALEQKRQDIDAYYNQETLFLKQQANDIQAKMAENDKMYKEAWKEVNLLNAELQSKRIEYEATLKREEFAAQERIQQSINALTQWRDTANYVLNMENTAQKWSDLRNQQEYLKMAIEKQDEVIKNLQADTSAKKSQSFKNYFSSVMDAINETAANGFRLFDMASGGTYGKAKKAAEALFTD